MKRLLSAAITAVVVVLMMQTFVALGLLRPVVVEGVSMAPTLDGERLLVDRTPTSPRRWDVVVARRPDDASRLCVKRVLGLPGERVAFRDGDLWIDGQRVAKPIAVQRKLRVPISSGPSEWRPTRNTWGMADGGWSPLDEEQAAVLGFAPSGGWPIRDDLPLNDQVSRQLNAVADAQVTASVSLGGDASVAITIDQAANRLVATIDRNRARLAVASGGDQEQLADASLGGARLIEATLSTFDGVPLLAIGGGPVLTLPSLPPAAVTGISIATAPGGPVTLSDLQVWRDLYYEADPRRGLRDSTDEWSLGTEAYFLVGDNQAVSTDSRTWGPAVGVPRRQLVGRVATAW
ncbi:MAG: signal peptidase I [Planctomycetota bacterium]